MPQKSVQQHATITIKDIIARAMPNLTPAHRRMASYVLAHSFRAATMTIDELAEATKVSVATTNRRRTICCQIQQRLCSVFCLQVFARLRPIPG